MVISPTIRLRNMIMFPALVRVGMRLGRRQVVLPYLPWVCRNGMITLDPIGFGWNRSTLTMRLPNLAGLNPLISLCRLGDLTRK